MPSLHLATTLMAAEVLSEVGPVPGALGWGYSAALAVALVYLGEHYAIDLVGGVALQQAVRRGAPRVAPAVRRVSRALQRLERLAAV
jgi:membrane-associated phospholipid phosphatase